MQEDDDTSASHHVRKRALVGGRLISMLSFGWQVFVGKDRYDHRNRIIARARQMEDVNMQGGKYKSALVRDGQWSYPEAEYSRQEISGNCECKVDGKACQDTPYEAYCDGSTFSNVHGANTYDRRTGMISLFLENHRVSDFVDIISMPVVQMSMSFAVSIENFYEVKDSLISGLAFVLGIDVNRIRIVDVVAGNARRRRRLLSTTRVFTPKVSNRRVLQDDEGINVDFEVLPLAELSVQNAFVQEDAEFANITIVRSVNLEEMCAAKLSSRESQDESTAATAPEDFSLTTVTAVFAPFETQTTVQVPIFNTEGYSSQDKSFIVVLSDPVNATLSVSEATVTILNVHSPAPPVPRLSGAVSPSSIPLAWEDPEWPNAPDGDVAEVLEYEVQKAAAAAPDGLGDEEWSDTTSTSDEQLFTFSELEIYSLWKFRVRARTQKGWTDWSPASEIYRTLSLCGDGVRHGNEECDTGFGGVGCVDCAIAAGYSCSISNGSDVCVAGCPDGIRTANEECDDNNNDAGDGCYLCRIEAGWNCASNEEGSTTSACDVTCGDGIRAGSEECDAGDSNGEGTGCEDDCSVASGAICVEDTNRMSVCRLCGNGQREDGEVCDDGLSSGGCPDCISITPGWKCEGGSADTDDLCTAGPDTPGAPRVSIRTDTSISWTWEDVNDNGLRVTSYRFEYDFSNRSGTFNLDRVIMIGDQGDGDQVQRPAVTIEGLARNASIQYRARVSACNLAGCSAASSFSTASVLPPSAQSQLGSVVKAIALDPDAISSSTNLTVTALILDVPDEECAEGETGSPCTPCDPGFFKAETGPAECDACPANSYTHDPPRVVCLCNAGYTGPDGGPCHSCPAGKFKEMEGSGSCTDCPAGTASQQTAAESSQTCTSCQPGHYAEQGAELCMPCASGKYSAVEGAESCADCAQGKYRATTGGAAETDCEGCAAGKYSPTMGASDETACQDCVAGKYGAQEARVSIEDCVACQAGRYSVAPGASSCDLCPAGTHSPYLGNTDAAECVTCSAGTYASQAQGATACIDCQAGESSPAGSVSSDDCQEIPGPCIAGYTGEPGSCSPCPPGTFKDSEGSSACAMCPPNSESVEGSTAW